MDGCAVFQWLCNGPNASFPCRETPLHPAPTAASTSTSTTQYRHQHPHPLPLPVPLKIDAPTDAPTDASFPRLFFSFSLFPPQKLTTLLATLLQRAASSPRGPSLWFANSVCTHCTAYCTHYTACCCYRGQPLSRAALPARSFQLSHTNRYVQRRCAQGTVSVSVVCCYHCCCCCCPAAAVVGGKAAWCLCWDGPCPGRQGHGGGSETTRTHLVTETAGEMGGGGRTDVGRLSWTLLLAVPVANRAQWLSAVLHDGGDGDGRWRRRQSATQNAADVLSGDSRLPPPALCRCLRGSCPVVVVVWPGLAKRRADALCPPPEAETVESEVEHKFRAGKKRDAFCRVAVLLLLLSAVAAAAAATACLFSRRLALVYLGSPVCASSSPHCFLSSLLLVRFSFLRASTNINPASI